MSDINEYDDILDEPEIVEPEVEIVEEETTETVEESETEAEEEVEAEKEEPTTGSKKEPWTLAAVLDEREKRQARDKTILELEAKLKEYEKPETDVSIFEDEKGFVEKQERRTQEALRNTALNMSEAFAESVFGEEKVAAAKQWMQTEGIKSPYALDQFNAAKLPYHTIVKLYDEDQVRRDPEAYKARLKAEALAELEKEKPKKSITPSLASKRSVGEAKVTTDDFEDMLNP